VRLIVLLLAAAVYSSAQSSNPPAAGLEPAWDISVVLQEIGVHAGRVLTALDQLNAQSWVSKGASETYVEQLDSSRQQARALGDEAKLLAHSPEKLSGSLQLFFRLEGLQNMITSLEEGARKYQGSQVAQELAAVYGEGGANRERFRSYIVNLAAEREHQFEVMDREAQRCRATFMAPTTPNKTSGRKK
jgi:hypothetical protein